MSLRPVTVITALLLCAGALVLGACGNKDAKGLIAAKNSAALRSHLDDLRSAVDAGKCPAATRALGQVDLDLRSLPESVDSRLVSELNDGYDKLSAKTASECNATAQGNQTTAVSKPTTAESAPTTEESVPTEPDTTPTEPPVTEPDTPSTEPNGGVSPGDPSTLPSDPTTDPGAPAPDPTTGGQP